MTVSLKHKFTSAKADSSDTTLIRPSNWNDEHALTLAAGKVLGRDTSGAGDAQELPLGFDTSGNISMSATGYFVPAVGTTAQRPSSPSTGMLRFNTSLASFETWNGSAWVGVGGSLTISDTPPSSPVAGALWWNSADGNLYLYYNDGNSSQWVVATAGGGQGGYLSLLGGTISGSVTATGTFTDGTATLRPLVSGTSQATTSGTNIDFPSIPSWAKRITLSFAGVSTSGTSPTLVQIGSGSVQNTGYTAYSSTIAAASSTLGSSTAGFIMQYASASATLLGHMVITNVSGNLWVASHQGAVLSTNTLVGGGSVTLSGALDRVRLTTVNGTDTFDAGSVNILYE